MTERRCKTCAEYIPGTGWCMSWNQHTAPTETCGRWYNEHGEARDVVRTRLSPVRAPRGSSVTIGAKVYLPRRAVQAMGSPRRVAVEIDPGARALVIRPDNGPDAWGLTRAGVGAPSLLHQLREHGWGPGRYAYRVVGREIHVQQGGISGGR